MQTQRPFKCSPGVPFNANSMSLLVQTSVPFTAVPVSLFAQAQCPLHHHFLSFLLARQASLSTYSAHVEPEISIIIIFIIITMALCISDRQQPRLPVVSKPCNLSAKCDHS